MCEAIKRSHHPRPPVTQVLVWSAVLTVQSQMSNQADSGRLGQDTTEQDMSERLQGTAIQQLTTASLSGLNLVSVGKKARD